MRATSDRGMCYRCMRPILYCVCKRVMKWFM